MGLRRTSTGTSRGVVLWVVAVCAFVSSAWGQPWLGSGTAADPYQIWYANDMQAIGGQPDYWEAHFRLMADIDLSGYDGLEGRPAFNIIGQNESGFGGVFDGNGHTIWNFTYTKTNGGANVGLFAKAHEARIENLGLVQPDLAVDFGDEGWYIGAMVGLAEFCIISNCYVEGGIVQGLGGQVIGGFLGYNDGVVSKCYSTSDVSGTVYVGGFVGGTGFSSVINNCYSQGAVDGYDAVGGLAGFNMAEISNCYSAGQVAGNNNIGGLIGYNGNGSYAKCFWDSDINPDVNGIGNTSDVNVMGKSTVNMQTEGTFTAAGWDFVGETTNGTGDIWKICEGTNYPKLAWQASLLADFACPDGVDMGDLAVFCGQWLFEELSADVWPAGGDGFVNFLDWAIIAHDWQATRDYHDVAEFTKQWLKTGANYCIGDIAPDGGDGVVNMVDFAVLAEIFGWEVRK
ncbi:MAG: hypothetical protein JSV99_08365 [Planctomycetota bacterium]|nr:MAG: hypothetical protein JSV99_08365 [Planctomycetota bacterium]